jgi:hypothetical protein
VGIQVNQPGELGQTVIGVDNPRHKRFHRSAAKHTLQTAAMYPKQEVALLSAVIFVAGGLLSFWGASLVDLVAPVLVATLRGALDLIGRTLAFALVVVTPALQLFAMLVAVAMFCLAVLFGVVCMSR